MGELRTRMINAMQLRQFSPRTQMSYLAAVVGLAKHYHQLPDQLSAEKDPGLSVTFDCGARSVLEFL